MQQDIITSTDANYPGVSNRWGTSPEGCAYSPDVNITSLLSEGNNEINIVINDLYGNLAGEPIILRSGRWKWFRVESGSKLLLQVLQLTLQFNESECWFSASCGLCGQNIVLRLL